MDELELLKKDWKRSEANLPKLTYDEIYKMIWKKSSSIVKWIFIISILEFAFWLLLSFAFKDVESVQKFDQMDSKHLMLGLTILSYIILAYFFFRFYTNYRKVNTTDNAKKLMENILRTRKTVKQYVIFNMIVLFVSMIVAMYVQINNDPNILSTVEQASLQGNEVLVYASFVGITLLAFVGIVILLLLFYYIIYGILLKKLNKNYNELKKLEI